MSAYVIFADLYKQYNNIYKITKDVFIKRHPGIKLLTYREYAQ